MSMPNSPNRSVEHDSRHSGGRTWLCITGVFLVLLAGFLSSRSPESMEPSESLVSTPNQSTVEKAASPPGPQSGLFRRFGKSWDVSRDTDTSKGYVAAKLKRFGQSRRELVHVLARRHGATVSAGVERFFDAVETGDWSRIETAFALINGGDSSAGHNTGRPPGIEPLWPAIIDAYGAAEQVHLWPAQQLIEYGEAILGSLRPGMVYVGGTDNGRWIPELLNDTSDGERHIIITQNGLADSTYLDYLAVLHGDRFTALTQQDSQQTFQDYITDAQRRLAHDTDFPNEPKQIRPGEDVRMEDGRVQVSGRTAVMAINERLLQTLMEKNPDLSFAIQESFPLQGTYADALPLGPLMELRAPDAGNDFTSERAGASLDFWKARTQEILENPGMVASESAMKSWSHDATSAANLLAAHDFHKEAEEAYRLSRQLWPGNPEAVGHLSRLLTRTGREEEAHRLVEQFIRDHPDQRGAIDGL